MITAAAAIIPGLLSTRTAVTPPVKWTLRSDLSRPGDTTAFCCLWWDATYELTPVPLRCTSEPRPRNVGDTGAAT